MPPASSVIGHLSEEVLFPAAAAVEAAGTIPASHFDALAAAGLYGALAPVELGGVDLGPAGLAAAIEELASGCLATTFVWIQHQGLVGALLDPAAPEALRASLLAPLVAGQVRAGIALAGSWPGPSPLRAEPHRGGWVLDGSAPWVTGWGYVDVLMAVARTGNDDLVTVVIDAEPGPHVVAHRQRLAAVDASATVRLEFDGAFVPAERVVGRRPFDPARQQREGLRPNGSLALGVARRCCALLGPSPLDDRLDRCRIDLDRADAEAMPGARAAAAELAVRAAATLAVAQGSGSALAGAHAERLWREAAFVLVFGSRAAIRSVLLERFSSDGP